MQVKQVIVVTRGEGAPARTVFDAKGAIVFGKELGEFESATVAVKFEGGQSITAVFDADGNCLSGRGDDVKGALHVEIFGSRDASSDAPEEEKLDPILPGLSPTAAPQEEPEPAPEGDSAVDSGDDIPSEFGADGPHEDEA